ncbi:conserved exported hypothetical protein [Candidatus Sulfotelmatobacter kueseliae]|uniref:Outer membrane protein beta-barrel domain-containing protein n=1 Tax=Candidatus Sulfotelmatobacter kueseliae TaxID=2042962 RepID=A0A2U3KIF4_9BACT|nr:conserved exported hypothetical protein [Candidatus Sulfotelmatobacter kueseliae]
MRKLGLLVLGCAAVALASFARAQEIDIMAGGGTLFSSKSTSSSQAYIPPPEKGGTYPSVGAEAIFKNHFGLNAEVAFRYHEAFYNGYQHFRPVLSDVNGVFAPRIGPKTSIDFMTGFGVQNLSFYNQFATCSGVCPTFISTHHFLLHAGAGVRYYFWRHFFVRPEAHYYYIVGNTDQFHSGNILRLGASIGYSFGRK